MDLTNESYTIVFHIDNDRATERYYKQSRHARDKNCWVKVSTRGNEINRDL